MIRIPSAADAQPFLDSHLAKGACHFLVGSRRQFQMRQRVQVMRVRPNLCHQHVGRKRMHRTRHNFTKRAQIYLIIRLTQKRKIDRVTVSRPYPNLIHVSRSGK